MAYTDLFNETIDDLTGILQTITGLRVVTDPRNINPPCCFLDAPSFTAWNGNIVKMVFPVRLIGAGPAYIEVLRKLLNMAAALLTKNIAVTDGNPAFITIGGQEYPAYDLNISIQGQAA